MVGFFALMMWISPPAVDDVDGPDHTTSPEPGVTCYVYETRPPLSGCVRNESADDYSGNISNITVEMEVPE
jgi:hypothetical protein